MTILEWIHLNKLYGISPFLEIFKLNLFWFCPIVSKFFFSIKVSNFVEKLLQTAFKYILMFAQAQTALCMKKRILYWFVLQNNVSQAVTACFRDRTHDSAQELYLNKLRNARVILTKSWWSSQKFGDTLFLSLPFIYKDTKMMLLQLQFSIKILIFYYSIFTLHPSCFYA